LPPSPNLTFAPPPPKTDRSETNAAAAGEEAEAPRAEGEEAAPAEAEEAAPAEPEVKVRPAAPKQFTGD
jgi:hypothetical protein